MSYFAHDTATIDEGAQIGSGTKIWHYSHVMSKAVVGKNCTLGQNVFIADHVVIGDNVKIQNNVSVYAGVICEDDVFLGPSMVFTNVINPRSAIIRSGEFLQTLVKKGASIGANATLICGNSIGQYAFVGAGSVVTKDIPDYSLQVGNPAKHTGWMSQYGEHLDFKNGIAHCPHTGSVYQIKNGVVSFYKVLTNN